MGNPIWCIFWLIVLWFFGFWVSCVCAFFYALIYPITVCIPALSGVSDILLKGAQFAHYCAQCMINGRAPF
ncbi:uncharacterized protein LOC121601501 [Anopheles merus]|uniref:uncharacterized protein LOC121601501 n=1 Tax=Anopheles merus TaxID=30066 RepID=UPI001BE3F7ED|nr:uncharacterized protein LOC121601501 [Anopheles merus]XP_041786261.1 uncharacterized protein LOC121601501 [Anopheles merus]XP_041786262.1 uncharacterized protein LOC121601501 [Anopheles merus]XP_041786263.1 uncharacterized protein LOC121601501 [Anopheles merus]